MKLSVELSRLTNPFCLRIMNISTSTYIATKNNPPTEGEKDMVVDKIEGKVIAKIKTPLTYDDSVKSIKYITPIRAMKEYMLSSKDIDNVPKYYSRSPYSFETRTVVFRKIDIENLAYEKHGGRERFENIRKLALEIERKQRAELFSMKKLSRIFHSSKEEKIVITQQKSLLYSPTGRVVMYAVAINGLNFIAKGIAWLMTGSKSIFSEALHSLADTVNQIIIAYGLHSSTQSPDENHPYGYVKMKNVTSLISGVGIFCLGAGISFYHGVHGLLHGYDIEFDPWAGTIMICSCLSESVTLILAYNQAVKTAKKEGFLLREYIMEGLDPSLNVVLLEDIAAILGVLVASGAMGIAYVFQAHHPDVFGSLIVSGILAGVAGFIVRTNADTLIGRSIPTYKKEAITKVVDKEKIIRGIYDVKATMIGGDYVKFKAEVDIDGRELTKRCLETVNLDKLLNDCNSIETKEELVHFLLKHGENVVHILGAEVNKIEDNIKKSFPSVKHIDIEIN